jgi:hypothetical protein
MGDLVGRDDDRDRVRKPGRLECGIDDPPMGRRCDGDRPASGDPVDGRDGAVDDRRAGRVALGDPPTTASTISGSSASDRPRRSRMILAQAAELAP